MSCEKRPADQTNWADSQIERVQTKPVAHHDDVHTHRYTPTFFPTTLANNSMAVPLIHISGSA